MKSSEWGETFEWADVDEPSSNSNLENYTVPKNQRPDLKKLSDQSDVLELPIIDMSETDNKLLVQEIANACQNFGFFQVINHGVRPELCDKVLDVITKFFEQTHRKKTHLVSRKHMENGKIYKYHIPNEDGGQIPMWSEAFFHHWHPTDHSYTENLPQFPCCYRKTIADYGKEIGSLMTRLLSLMSQGLGLEEDYFQRFFKDNDDYTAQANYYPPCPKPEHTLGLRPHFDLKVLTVLLQEQGVVGLHVLTHQNGWIAVNPKQNALVINLADQFQVLSNDKFKSVLHRAVNSHRKRVSFAMFYGPRKDMSIEPIRELTVHENIRPIYRKYTFREYLEELGKQKGDDITSVKDAFKIDYNSQE